MSNISDLLALPRGELRALGRSLRTGLNVVAEAAPETAVELTALYSQWSDLIGETVYEGFAFAYGDWLYRVIEHGTDASGQPLEHTFQAHWPPDQAPSLYARILPGQNGAIGPWERPDSTNGYRKGQQVTHNGKTWESDQDNNVWEPGTTGAPWHEVTA